MSRRPAVPVAALLLAAGAAALPTAAACTLPADAGATLAEGPVQLAWRADPAPAIGRGFALHLVVCPADARLVRVDATMPDHRHGMNYRPSVHALGEGRWRADGLLWHMGGRWELRFDVEAGGVRHSLRQDVPLR
ncbi:MAG: hypothetical protein KF863_04050 [Rubrivivax sp.]|nr:hypothetical protein [Rubrivivax sp.]